MVLILVIVFIIYLYKKHEDSKKNSSVEKTALEDISNEVLHSAQQEEIKRKYLKENYEIIKRNLNFSDSISREKLHIVSDIQDLSNYNNEECNCLDLIFALRNQLVLNIDNEVSDNCGWKLAMKHNYNSSEESKNSFYLFALNINGDFEYYFSEFGDYGEFFSKEKIYNSSNISELLQELDYDGYYRSAYNEGDFIQYVSLYGNSYIDLTRHYEKGVGLLLKLEEILQKNIQPVYIDNPMKLNVTLKDLEKRKQQERWQINGKCRYCGGDFYGFFSKKCSSCGKPKDY